VANSSSITTEGTRRFQCIGGDCEYTCCSGWTIPVDRVHFDLLKTRMEETASGRRAFANAVVRREGDEVYASMRLLGGGNCACLSPDKLCQIQVAYGEALLPNACAQYPRGLGIVGEQQEMWGSLSCPEMARQCLLADDGMALVTIDAEPFSRLLERRALANAERPYDSQLDTVRTAVLAALSLRQLSMPFRLFLLAGLGERTAGFFHRDVATLDGARLETELSRLRNPEVHAVAQQAFRALRVPGPVAANVVAGIVASGQDRELRPLVSKVLRSYVREGCVTEHGDRFGARQPEQLWESYGRRRLAWESSFGDRLALAFEAHAKSYWLKEWYVTSPNLLAHLQIYLCQAAMTRFLLFGHPDLLAVWDSPDGELRGRTLDLALVEVVSRVTRATEHSPAFVRGIQAAFALDRSQDFGHVAVLAIA
jgi:lysine-N-methylase